MIRVTFFLAAVLLVLRCSSVLHADDKVVVAPPMFQAERIEVDDDKAFPKNARRIDFDKSPAGKPVEPKADISKTYIPWGCVLETSVATSYVCAEPYNVGGRSGKQCAANHEPLFQGVMTIRFCKPGDATTKATVRYVGFWVSHVAPNGTALEAYNAEGKLIKSIEVDDDRKDFLALKSRVPIAFVKVVPNLKIDQDFAIDDLVFDPPKPSMP